MAVEFNFISYMRDEIAAKLKELQHTETNPHFHRIMGIADMEEFIGNQLLSDGYQLLAEDREDVRAVGSEDNHLHRNFFSFYITKDFVPGDFDSIETAKKDCKKVAEKIISRMKYDWKAEKKLPATQWTHNIALLEPMSFTIRTVGPLGDNYIAAYVSFTVMSVPNLTYNPDDWL